MPFPLPLAQAQSKSAELIDGLARTPLSQVVVFVALLTVVRVLMAPTLAKTPPHLRTGGFRGLRLANEFLDAIIYAGVFVFMIIRPFGVQAFRIPSGSMWPTLYVNDFVVANKAVYRYSDPKAGDVVVFRPPDEAIMSPDQRDADGQIKVDFIKRCVGVPGDVVELRDGVLYRNGKVSPDPTKNYSESIDGGNTFTKISPDSVTRASFKLATYHGRVVPLNYNSDEANISSQGSGYQINPTFIVDAQDQRAMIDAPPEKVPAGYYLMMGDNRNNSFDGRGWGLVKRDRIIGRSEFTWLPLTRLGRTRSVDLGK